MVVSIFPLVGWASLNQCRTERECIEKPMPIPYTFLQSQDSPDRPAGHFKVKFCQARLGKVKQAAEPSLVQAWAPLRWSLGQPLLTTDTKACPSTQSHQITPSLWRGPHLSALVLLKPRPPPVNTCPDPSDHPGIPNCCLLTINWLQIKRKGHCQSTSFPSGTSFFW